MTLPPTEDILRTELTRLLSSGALSRLLNKSLQAICRNSSESPSGSFDEVLLAHFDDYDLYSVSAESKALYGGLYIAGGYRSELIFNPMGVAADINVYRQSHSDGKPLPLESEGTQSLPPKCSLWIPAGRRTHVRYSPSEGVLISLRAHDDEGKSWMYDAATLSPVYEVSHDANRNQVLFLLNTLRGLREECEPSVIDSMISGDDGTFRVAAWKYLLQIHPRRGLKVIGQAAGEASPEGELAREILQTLAGLGKNTNHRST